MKRLEGKNAILTGVARGAGQAFAKTYFRDVAQAGLCGKQWSVAFCANYECEAREQKKKEVGDAVPFGRMGQAKDLIGMAVFLASDDANYIVAKTYNVDSGNWMS